MQDGRSGNGPRGAEVHKQDLSGPRRKLVELMQEVGFGRIEGLRVARGEPVLEPRPRVQRTVILGRDADRPHPQGSGALKGQILDLFRRFEAEPHAFIKELTIDNGLPIRMTVTDEELS